MRRMRSKVKAWSHFLEDEQGQGTVEYILILSVAIWGSSQLVSAFFSGLDQGILRLGAQLEKDLKTGRAPLSVWTN